MASASGFVVHGVFSQEAIDVARDSETRACCYNLAWQLGMIDTCRLVGPGALDSAGGEVDVDVSVEC